MTEEDFSKITEAGKLRLRGKPQSGATVDPLGGVLPKKKKEKKQSTKKQKNQQNKSERKCTLLGVAHRCASRQRPGGRPSWS